MECVNECRARMKTREKKAKEAVEREEGQLKGKRVRVVKGIGSGAAKKEASMVVKRNKRQTAKKKASMAVKGKESRLAKRETTMAVKGKGSRTAIGREAAEDKGLPLISVIIPLYNVESYLGRCLESVLKQTYPNLEIILVDDGSTDASGKICQRYAAVDSRIRYYYKDNGGVSAARNFGLAKARGAYITFVDSDDYIAPDYVAYLYNLIRSHGKGQLGMAMCSLYVCYNSNGHRFTQADGRTEILSGKECIERMCYDDQVDTCIYAKLYPASLFEGISFPCGRIFEDMAVSYRLFDRCDQVICGWMPKYFYVLHEDSIVTSPYSSSKLDLLAVTDQMASYVNKKYPDLRRAVERRRIYARFSTLNHMLDLEGDQEKKIRENMIYYIKKHGWRVFTDPRASYRDRVAWLSLMMGFSFYRLLWRAYYWWQRKRRVFLSK